MTDCPRLIEDSISLTSNFSSLKRGDIICGKIKLHIHEEHIFVDLLERNVYLIPSAMSQMASRSKTFQAKIFSPWMVPGTTAIYSTPHLLENIHRFQNNTSGRVVVKHDRRNAGAGILLYNSVEDVYNQAANNALRFPFVLQPFLDGSEDIRLIIIDTFVEAYRRTNSSNFRKNLHCGATATPFEPTPKILAFCREVMERGGFPYGHLDLLLSAKGEIFLSEINLRGGIRGAQITSDEYRERVTAVEKKLLARQLQQDSQA